MTDAYQRGMATRREVLGDAYVDVVVDQGDEWFGEFQRMATEWAWNGIWNREGLSRRDRSLVQIGVLVAKGEEALLGVHIVGAMRNGLRVEEVREAILQTIPHCGFPAALRALQVASRTIQRQDEAPNPEELGF